MSDSELDNKFAYKVQQDGIYTAVFNPAKDNGLGGGEECGFWCENKWVILSVCCSLIVFGLILSYVIWRVSRYMTKYRQAKKQMQNFRE